MMKFNTYNKYKKKQPNDISMDTYLHDMQMSGFFLFLFLFCCFFFFSLFDVFWILVSKARHRGDILEFTIKNNHYLTISSATFHLYVHGEEWRTENEAANPTSVSGQSNRYHNNKAANGNNLSISINRFVHRHQQQVKFLNYY